MGEYGAGVMVPEAAGDIGRDGGGRRYTSKEGGKWWSWGWWRLGWEAKAAKGHHL